MVNYKSVCRFVLIVFLALLLVRCQDDSGIKDSDKFLLGRYRHESGAHYEILELKANYRLNSVYSSRGFQWAKFQESGSWRTSGDTVIIDRTRHDSLKGWDTVELLIIKNDKLYEIDTNYNNQLFLTPYFFESQ